MAFRAFLDNPNFFYPLRWGFICFREGIKNKEMKRVNIFIEIQSQIDGLDSALTKGPERVGKNVGLPATATIIAVQRSKRIEGEYMFMLNFGINHAPGLLGNWLYEKINGRATKLFMDQTEVPIDETEIGRVISEKIGKESNLDRT
jgi:hypothetical protein